jgi:hypothetical protein
MNVSGVLSAVIWLAILGLVVLFGARALGWAGGRAAAAV